MVLPEVRNGRPRILLVDDDPANLFALEAALEAVDADLLQATSGARALGHLLASDFAAIVLDVRMPGMDGFETATLIRSRRCSAHIPILFMTGYCDDEHLFRGYELGAVDFLFKPVNPYILRAKIRVFIELARKASSLQNFAGEIRRLNVDLEAEVGRRTIEINRAKLEAESANREKSRFLANMSHEFRTPLNTVIGFSEMLHEEALSRGMGDFAPDLLKIRGAANHLLGLLNNVLDMSRIEAGKVSVLAERFEVDTMLQDVISTAAPLMQKNGNRLEYDGRPLKISMLSDQTKVRQCLLNLLSNAAKFTVGGRVLLENNFDAERIQFRVSDSGAGMSSEQMGRLFQPFTQVHVDHAAQGSGLGLAITHRLCGLLGGEISVASEIGAGSCFSISLPLSMQQTHGYAAT